MSDFGKKIFWFLKVKVEAAKLLMMTKPYCSVIILYGGKYEGFSIGPDTRSYRDRELKKCKI